MIADALCSCPACPCVTHVHAGICPDCVADCHARDHYDRRCEDCDRPTRWGAECSDCMQLPPDDIARMVAESRDHALDAMGRAERRVRTTTERVEVG